jgi:hypothetical protein
LAGVTGDREGISQATHRIMSRIAEQLPADMRGPYATIEGTRDCPPGSEDSLN